ncbi:MAG: FkbM family methyltransferase, partial [Opitutia bacterium]
GAKLSLIADFIGYHLANRCGAALAGDEAPVKKYPVWLAGRPAELHLRPRGGDFYVLHEIFGRGLFAARDELAAVIDLSRVRSFLDLGANVGLVSFYYAGLLPSAKFVCVEPDAVNFRILSANLAALGDRTVLVEGAAAAIAGFLSVDVTGQSYRKRLSAEGSVKVRALTVAEIMAAGGLSQIDLLKIDIEGAEKVLLTGDLGWLSATTALLIEIHDDFLETDLRRVLEPKGFSVKRLSVGENFLAIRK